MWDLNDGTLIRTVKNYSGWGYKILFFFQNIPNLATENKYLTKYILRTLKKASSP